MADKLLLDLDMGWHDLGSTPKKVENSDSSDYSNKQLGQPTTPVVGLTEQDLLNFLDSGQDGQTKESKSTEAIGDDPSTAQIQKSGSDYLAELDPLFQASPTTNYQKTNVTTSSKSFEDILALFPKNKQVSAVERPSDLFTSTSSAADLDTISPTPKSPKEQVIKFLSDNVELPHGGDKASYEPSVEQMTHKSGMNKPDDVTQSPKVPPVPSRRMKNIDFLPSQDKPSVPSQPEPEQKEYSNIELNRSTTKIAHPPDLITIQSKYSIPSQPEPEQREYSNIELNRSTTKVVQSLDLPSMQGKTSVSSQPEVEQREYSNIELNKSTTKSVQSPPVPSRETHDEMDPLPTYDVIFPQEEKRESQRPASPSIYEEIPGMHPEIYSEISTQGNIHIGMANKKTSSSGNEGSPFKTNQSDSAENIYSMPETFNDDLPEIPKQEDTYQVPETGDIYSLPKKNKTVQYQVGDEYSFPEDPILTPTKVNSNLEPQKGYSPYGKSKIQNTPLDSTTHLASPAGVQIKAPKRDKFNPCGFVLNNVHTIIIHKGDITRIHVDSIVNPSNDKLVHITELSRSIAEAAGPDLLTACVSIINSKGQLQNAQVVHTHAGRLPCDRVIHAVGPPWPAMGNSSQQKQCKLQLRETYDNILTCATQINCKMLAIPPVSSGTFQIPCEEMATCLYQSLLNYAQIHTKRGGSYVEEIHIIDTTPTFLKATMKLFLDGVKYSDGVLVTALERIKSDVLRLTRPSSSRTSKLSKASKNPVLSAIQTSMPTSTITQSPSALHQSSLSPNGLQSITSSKQAINEPSRIQEPHMNVEFSQKEQSQLTLENQNYDLFDPMQSQKIPNRTPAEQQDYQNFDFSALSNKAISPKPRNINSGTEKEIPPELPPRPSSQQSQKLPVLDSSQLANTSQRSNSKPSAEDIYEEAPETTEWYNTERRQNVLNISHESYPMLSRSLPCGFIVGNIYQVFIHSNDITKIRVDAIANSSNRHIKPSGELAKAIAKAAGAEFIEDCENITRQRGVVATTEVVDTQGWQLPCKHVLHAVGPWWPEDSELLQQQCLVDLQTTFENVISYANQMNVKSIAIPAISAGKGGVPVEHAVSCLYQAFQSSARQALYGNVGSVEIIHIVDKETQFLESIAEKFEQTQGIPGGIKVAVVPESSVINALRHVMIPATQPTPHAVQQVGAPTSPSGVVQPGQSQPPPYQNAERFSLSLSQGGTGARPKTAHQQGSSPKAARAFQPKAFRIGNKLDIILHTCDITKINVDAIVNPTNSQLQHTTGMSKTIAQAAGPEMTMYSEEIINFQGLVQVSEVVQTPPGCLPSKIVFHTVGPKWPQHEDRREQTHRLQQLQDTFVNVLEEATQSGATTIAIPAIGLGLFKIPLTHISEKMLDAIRVYYIKHGNCSNAISEIHIIDINPDVLYGIHSHFEREGHKTMNQDFAASDHLVEAAIQRVMLPPEAIEQVPAPIFTQPSRPAPHEEPPRYTLEPTQQNLDWVDRSRPRIPRSQGSRGSTPVLQTNTFSEILQRPFEPRGYKIKDNSFQTEVNVFIHLNDIAKLQVDAIIVPANKRLKMKSGWSGIIGSAAGPKIKEETSKMVKMAKFPSGAVIETGPGNLSCKCLLHAVVPKWPDSESQVDSNAAEWRACGRKVRMSFENIFTKIEEKGSIKTIAVPPLINDASRLNPLDIISSIMCQVLHKCPASKLLNEIHIVDFHDQSLKFLVGKFDTACSMSSHGVDTLPIDEEVDEAIIRVSGSLDPGPMDGIYAEIPAGDTEHGKGHGLADAKYKVNKFFGRLTKLRVSKKRKSGKPDDSSQRERRHSVV